MGAPKGSVPWNAGTSEGWTDKRGYRWIYITENGIRRARREHRVVMETTLGRRLEPWELVHHKDGDKSNNHPDNLEVLGWGEHSTGHHEGSERSDLVKERIRRGALMREEIKHLRRVNRDLLEALENAFEHAEATFPEPALRRRVRNQMRAAIAKARGS